MASRSLDRRMLPAVLAAAAALCIGALSAGATRAADLSSATPGPVAADVSRDVVTQAEADAQRDYDLLPSLPPLTPGPVKTIHLNAEVKRWTPAPGVTTDAWTYDGTVPGPTIHVRQGD